MSRKSLYFFHFLNYEYVTTYVSNPAYEPVKKAFCEMKEIIQCFLSDKEAK